MLNFLRLSLFVLLWQGLAGLAMDPPAPNPEEKQKIFESSIVTFLKEMKENDNTDTVLGSTSKIEKAVTAAKIPLLTIEYAFFLEFLPHVDGCKSLDTLVNKFLAHIKENGPSPEDPVRKFVEEAIKNKMIDENALDILTKFSERDANVIIELETSLGRDAKKPAPRKRDDLDTSSGLRARQAAPKDLDNLLKAPRKVTLDNNLDTSSGINTQQAAPKDLDNLLKAPRKVTLDNTLKPSIQKKPAPPEISLKDQFAAILKELLKIAYPAINKSYIDYVSHKKTCTIL